MRLSPLVALCLPLLLTGCALTPTATPTLAKGLVIHGKAIGGQQPIAGSHVYLMAANTTGYGNASLSLLNASATLKSDSVGAYVLTDTFGGFDITADYTCTTNTQVYLYALGGNPGAGINSGAALLALLGNCPASGNFATATPFIYMNEVSTIAAAYSMAGFATDATHVSSSGSALAQAGIANAFLTSSNLESLGSGQALAATPAGNGTVPQTTINSLANILAACINSTGPSSTSCSGLFTNTTSGGVTPTDTASAAINIAHHPGSNVANLFNLTPATPPFAPNLAAKPNDFMLALGFSGGGLNQPNYVAIDAVGNAWATNLNAAANSLTALSPLGIPLANSPFSGNGLSGPGNHAIDDAGNIWVPNTTKTTVSKFTSSGAAAVGSPFNAGTTPISVAIDPFGNAWIANSGSNNVTKLSPSGVEASGSPFAAGAKPATVAADALGGIWLANYNAGTTITKLTNAGTPAPGSPFSNVIDEEFVAIDASNNAWVSSNTAGANSVAKLSNTGTPYAGSPYSGGGIGNPYNSSFDGAGNLWIANASNLSELSPSGAALSPSTTYAPGVLNNTSGIAIDGSGNLWISDYGASKLVEIVGSAAPVVTPLATGIKNNTLATRP